MDFGFDAQQRTSLQAFGKGHTSSLSRSVPHEFAERQINALRCTACHVLDHQEDTWSRIRQEQEAAGLQLKLPKELAATLGRKNVSDLQKRPALTWAGEKLNPDWMEAFIAGKIHRKPRPGLLAKMPAFPTWAPHLTKGLVLAHGLDHRPESLDPIDQELVKGTPNIFEAFTCTICHGIGTKLPIGGSTLQAISLDVITSRLRKTYFDWYMWNPAGVDPTTLMPTFAKPDGRSTFPGVLDGDAERQFEAIWNHLRLLEATGTEQPR